jgi:hypothetical protein
MIVFLQGRVDTPPEDDGVWVQTPRDRIRARALAPIEPVETGAEVIVVVASVHVGVTAHEFAVVLGAWAPGLPDPSDPAGLASTPVVLLPDGRAEPIAVAGAGRAGRDPDVIRLDGSAPALGLALLRARASGAEVVVVAPADGRQLDLVRVLGGRAVLALPLTDPDSVRSWLGAAELDADIPIPVGLRDVVRRAIGPLHLEDVHQLVEVDPSPAFDAAGRNAEDASIAELAAGSAGVLAGRIAAGNRRWRAALEP